MASVLVLVLANLLLETVADKVDRSVHIGRALFCLDEKMFQVENDVHNLQLALHAQRHVCIDDLVEVVCDVADLLFCVASQRRGDLEVPAFDVYLHERTRSTESWTCALRSGNGASSPVNITGTVDVKSTVEPSSTATAGSACAGCGRMKNHAATDNAATRMIRTMIRAM